MPNLPPLSFSEWLTLISLLVAGIVGWTTLKLSQQHDRARISKLEDRATALGRIIDQQRERLIIVERDQKYHTDALARIEASITSATARLEAQLSHMSRRIDEALDARPGRG